MPPKEGLSNSSTLQEMCKPVPGDVQAWVERGYLRAQNSVDSLTWF